jgi:hypothetical protein
MQMPKLRGVSQTFGSQPYDKASVGGHGVIIIYFELTMDLYIAGIQLKIRTNKYKIGS